MGGVEIDRRGGEREGSDDVNTQKDYRQTDRQTVSATMGRRRREQSRVFTIEQRVRE
jgi:hypothetical protein